MAFHPRVLSSLVLACAALLPLHAATVSRQTADVFARKIAQIQQQGRTELNVGRRTSVTQDEVNSWFAYRAATLLPAGVSEPQVTILGQGRVSGTATVDLESLAKRRGSGGTFDPWSYLSGRVPVTVTGVLHTEDGRGRFELHGADVSGVPVSPTLLQEMVTFYSRTPAHPDGVRLDETFVLPANIERIEVGQGSAVVVQ